MVLPTKFINVKFTVVCVVTVLICTSIIDAIRVPSDAHDEHVPETPLSRRGHRHGVHEPGYGNPEIGSQYGQEGIDYTVRGEFGRRRGGRLRGFGRGRGNRRRYFRGRGRDEFHEGGYGDYDESRGLANQGGYNGYNGGGVHPPRGGTGYAGTTNAGSNGYNEGSFSPNQGGFGSDLPGGPTRGYGDNVEDRHSRDDGAVSIDARKKPRGE